MARQVPLVGKAALGLRQAELVPDEVHQVGGILAVVDGEGRIEADLPGIVAQQPRADAVEGARPRSARRPAAAPCRPSTSPTIRSTRRAISAAARREKVISRMRRGSAPLDDQVRDAMRQRVGLARAGAGDDQQRPGDRAAAMLDGRALLVVQPVEIGGVERSNQGRRRSCAHEPRFWFVRNAILTEPHTGVWARQTSVSIVKQASSLSSEACRSDRVQRIRHC